MKHIFLLAAASALMTFGCTNTSEQKKTTYTVQEVETAVEELRQLLVDPDEQKLQNITADQLTYGHSNGLVENKKECIEAIISGKFNFESMTLSEQTIDLSGDVAIVRHILQGTTHDVGKEPGTAHLKVLQVWQHQAGHWKLLARQAVKILPQS